MSKDDKLGPKYVFLVNIYSITQPFTKPITQLIPQPQIQSQNF